MIFEFNEAIKSGLSNFKQFVEQKLALNPNFLELFFWDKDGSQMTLLNYLIHSYSDKNKFAGPSSTVLLSMIDYVVCIRENLDIDTPLHQAVSEGKVKLAIHLLETNYQDLAERFINKEKSLNEDNTRRKKSHFFNVNQCDSQGQTLLSLVLASKNSQLLTALLKKKPNIHRPSRINQSKVLFQPIHQAVVLNNPEAIRLLIQQGAQVDNPCGIGQDTPLLLAAHLCKIEALEALLKQPINLLFLEAEGLAEKGKRSHRAIERLCEHLSAGNNKASALRGIAMLLCHGAEPPRYEMMREVLCDNRSALLKYIQRYLEDKPQLVEPFVQRCHLTESALHNIVYARHYWGNSWRQLFGKPSDIAFTIENLVVRKNTINSSAQKAGAPQIVAERITSEMDPLKLYAFFVQRYKKAYEKKFFTNSWSTMRWMIAQGECDWSKVQRYVETNPKSRSAIIYYEMFKPTPRQNENIETLNNNRLAVAR